MDQASLETALASVPINQIRYFDRLGSTNDEAARWADLGAPDLALVVADEQTAGKGRLGRKWVTPPGAALAFSLILRPEMDVTQVLQRWSGLGALAVCEALKELYALRPEIKWPNDVLLDRRKMAGVLVETVWSGEKPASLILGIGINVAPASVSEIAHAHLSPNSELIFPATCIEQIVHHPVERLPLLRHVLERVIAWRARLASPEFITSWEDWLAFQGEWVHFLPGEALPEKSLPGQAPKSPPAVVEGRILGLAPDGALRLRTLAGEEIIMRVGDVRLRPL